MLHSWLITTKKMHVKNCKNGIETISASYNFNILKMSVLTKSYCTVNAALLIEAATFITS